MAVNQLVAVAVVAAGAVVTLWLLIRSARGRSRLLGVIGTVLILLGVLSRFGYQWMVERFLGRVDDSTIISILAADTAAGGVLTGAGLLVVTRAIIDAGSQPKL